MTDKLPIERLEDLERKRIEHMGAYDLANMKDAIRELIALRKAEPVAYMSEDDLAALSSDKLRPIYAYSDDGDIALIRKPEPKCIENTNDPAGLDRLINGR